MTDLDSNAITRQFVDLLREIYRPLSDCAPPENATALQDGMLQYYNQVAPLQDGNMERKIGEVDIASIWPFGGNT